MLSCGNPRLLVKKTRLRSGGWYIRIQNFDEEDICPPFCHPNTILHIDVYEDLVLIVDEKNPALVIFYQLDQDGLFSSFNETEDDNMDKEEEDEGEEEVLDSSFELLSPVVEEEGKEDETTTPRGYILLGRKRIEIDNSPNRIDKIHFFDHSQVLALINNEIYLLNFRNNDAKEEEEDVLSIQLSVTKRFLNRPTYNSLRNEKNSVIRNLTFSHSSRRLAFVIYDNSRQLLHMFVVQFPNEIISGDDMDSILVTNKEDISSLLCNREAIQPLPETSLLISDDGNVLIFGDEEGKNYHIFNIYERKRGYPRKTPCICIDRVEKKKFYRGRKPSVVKNISFSHDGSFFVVNTDRSTIHVFSTSQPRANPNQYFGGRFSSVRRAFAKFRKPENFDSGSSSSICVFGEKSNIIHIFSFNVESSSSSSMILQFDETKGGDCVVISKDKHRNDKKKNLRIEIQNILFCELHVKDKEEEEEDSKKNKEMNRDIVRTADPSLHELLKKRLMKDDDDFYFEFCIDGKMVRSTTPMPADYIRGVIMDKNKRKFSFNLSISEQQTRRLENTVLSIQIIRVRGQKPIFDFRYTLPRKKLIHGHNYTITNISPSETSQRKSLTHTIGFPLGAVLLAPVLSVVTAPIVLPIVTLGGGAYGLLLGYLYGSGYDMDYLDEGIVDRGFRNSNPISLYVTGPALGLVGGVAGLAAGTIAAPFYSTYACGGVMWEEGVKKVKNPLSKNYQFLNVVTCITLEAIDFGAKVNDDEDESTDFSISFYFPFYRLFSGEYPGFRLILKNIFEYLYGGPNWWKDLCRLMKVSPYFARIMFTVIREQYDREKLVYEEEKEEEEKDENNDYYGADFHDESYNWNRKWKRRKDDLNKLNFNGGYTEKFLELLVD